MVLLNELAVLTRNFGVRVSLDVVFHFLYVGIFKGLVASLEPQIVSPSAFGLIDHRSLVGVLQLLFKFTILLRERGSRLVGNLFSPVKDGLDVLLDDASFFIALGVQAPREFVRFKQHIVNARGIGFLSFGIALLTGDNALVERGITDFCEFGCDSLFFIGTARFHGSNLLVNVCELCFKLFQLLTLALEGSIILHKLIVVLLGELGIARLRSLRGSHTTIVRLQVGLIALHSIGSIQSLCRVAHSLLLLISLYALRVNDRCVKFGGFPSKSHRLYLLVIKRTCVPKSLCWHREFPCSLPCRYDASCHF